MLAIRMQRTGRKGHAMFRVVVQDSRRTPTSGKVVALLGSYDPLTNVPSALRIVAEFNPMSYAVDAMRDTLIGQTHFGFLKDFIVLAITTIILMAFGAYRFRHIEA